MKKPAKTPVVSATVRTRHAEELLPGVVRIATPSERARLRAASAAYTQRMARTRREAEAVVQATEPAPAIWERLPLRGPRTGTHPMAVRWEEETQPPVRHSATASAIGTAAGIAMVAGCVLLAMWLGGR